MIRCKKPLFLLLLLPTLIKCSVAGDLISVRVQDSFNLSAYFGSYTLCEAVKLCHDMGQGILSRDALSAIRAGSEFRDAVGNGHNWWIGLVDALNERNTSRDGWMWIEDGTYTNATEGDPIFFSKEPDNRKGSNGEDCAAIDSSYIYAFDDICVSKYNALCYTSDGDTVPPALISGSIFVSFTKALILTYSQLDPGCSIDVSLPNMTLLACLGKCLAIPHSDCVGLYWNSARRQCILLPYFDAAVQLDYGTNEEKLLWEKFLKK
ncbi:hypothetical protein BOX15_Mlig020453g1 [Macrostomum lignano]|uniref:C-type lectin domain-containing protein n=3 Tax=Macrostomum lignano TaxID=282301 RepID=A0A1I8HUW0_9PLAT|nr:hypothetical protein BOX15_Mlig020453g1 [Macrostomum lignano]